MPATVLLDTGSVRRTLRTRHQFSNAGHIDTGVDNERRITAQHSGGDDSASPMAASRLRRRVRDQHPHSRAEFDGDRQKTRPIFERDILGNRFVFASGADMVAELSDESRFAKHLAPGVASLREVGGDGLFTAYNHEPNWGKAHNLLAPAFTKSAMRSYHRTMLDVAGELTEHWDERVGDSPVDVSSDMTKLTLETIGRTGFSYSFDSFRRERPHPFVQAMVGALSHSQRTTFVKSTALGRLLVRRSDRRNVANLEHMAEVVDEVIRARRDSAEAGPEDLLELMLRAARENDPHRIDELNIRHQVVTFLVAGHETTSGALSFALYYLSRHPDVLAKAQAEVDAVWGDEEPAFEQVAKLRYVRRVLDESLRLWPTAPAYGREATVDTTLVGTYPMKVGDWVLVLIPALHRDPCGVTTRRRSTPTISCPSASGPVPRTCTSRSGPASAPASDAVRPPRGGAGSRHDPAPVRHRGRPRLPPEGRRAAHPHAGGIHAAVTPTLSTAAP